jgi:sRNA-binding carbon storage regulator CsrA
LVQVQVLVLVRVQVQVLVLVRVQVQVQVLVLVRVQVQVRVRVRVLVRVLVHVQVHVQVWVTAKTTCDRTVKGVTMLVLRFKRGDKVAISTPKGELMVELVEIRKDQIRLGFTGSREIPIVREGAKNKLPKKETISGDK